MAETARTTSAGLAAEVVAAPPSLGAAVSLAALWLTQKYVTPEARSAMTTPAPTAPPMMAPSGRDSEDEDEDEEPAAAARPAGGDTDGEGLGVGDGVGDAEGQGGVAMLKGPPIEGTL